MHTALGIAIPVVFFLGIGMLFHKRTRLHARLFLMLAVFLLVTATKNRPKERPDDSPSPVVTGGAFGGPGRSAESHKR